MNKMHSLAKIILVGFGLYLGYHFVSSLLFTILALVSNTLHGSQIIFTLSVLLVYSCFVFAIYQLIHRREKWAAKIVGASDTPQSQEQVDWLPFSYRLVSIAGGLYCLCRLILMTGFIVQRYLWARTSNTTHSEYVLEYFLSLPVLLATAIYLLYGAPHFVRWHVKKTLAQCKTVSEVN